MTIRWNPRQQRAMLNRLHAAAVLRSVARLVERSWPTVRSFLPASFVVLAGAMLLTVWRTTFADVVWQMLVDIAHAPGGAQWLFTAAVWWLILARVVHMVRHRLPVGRGDAAYALMTAPARGRAVRAGTRVPERSEVMNLSRRARHESAHMVAGLAMGRTPVAIDVRCVGDRDGSCATADPSSASMVDAAWSRMVTALAGNVIDLAADNQDQGSARDVHQAYQDAAVIVSCGVAPTGYAGALTFDGLLLGARRIASVALERHHLAFETLAERLIETGGRTTLTAEDLADVVAMVASAAATGEEMHR